MLNDAQREAMRRWYGQDEVLAEAKRLFDGGELDEVEDYLHKTCLMSLGRHDDLPDFMRKEDGKTLFPTNLNPVKDEENWQDAIEIGWKVVEEKLGIVHDEIHRHIASEQQADWKAFMESVERRKKERGLE